METTYVTFGQIHKHIIGDKTFDKDCVATISCESASHGRQLTVDTFGDKFGLSYHEDEFDKNSMRFFPRGYLAVAMPKKEEPEDFKGMAHNRFLDKIVDARHTYVETMAKGIAEGSGTVSTGDLARIEVSAFLVEASNSILGTKSILEKVNSQIKNQEVIDDILTGVIAESVSELMDELLPRVIGVKNASIVAEKMLKAKLNAMGEQNDPV